MRVMVTGHKGYLGTALTPRLAASGHRVFGLDSDLYQQCTFGEALPEIDHLNQDIRDIDIDDLRGFEAVIHLAGLSNDPLGDLDPELTMEINHRASVRLAKLAKAAGVPRFVFSSSTSIYGAVGPALVTEESSFAPLTPYALSKMLTERDLARLADDRFSPTFLRMATVYGVSPRLRFDLVLNNLTAWAFTTGRVLIKSDGSPWRPVVHVDDVALAFLTVLEAPRKTVHNQAYHVGITNENYQVRQLAEIVRNTVPGSRVEYSPEPVEDPRCYRVDCSKISNAFPAFTPKWKARQGAGQLYETFRGSGLSANDFEGPKYKRIEHIRYLLQAGCLDRTLRRTG